MKNRDRIKALEDQNELLLRQVGQLRSRDEGYREVSKVADALMIRLATSFGRRTPEGMQLRFRRADIADSALYSIRSAIDRDTDEMVVTVTKKEEEQK